MARQRYCCGLARCWRALGLSADRAENAARKTRVIRRPDRGIRFAHDLYGAFPVKRLLSGFAHSSLFGAGKAVLHPVACDPVPGARGRGQGTETLAELGGLPL